MTALIVRAHPDRALRRHGPHVRRRPRHLLRHQLGPRSRHLTGLGRGDLALDRAAYLERGWSAAATRRLALILRGTPVHPCTATHKGQRREPHAGWARDGIPSYTEKSDHFTA